MRLHRAPANAYQETFLSTIGETLASLEADNEIRVVILESGLEKFFCAGADIAVFQSNSVAQNLALVAQARRNAAAIENSNKIIIAKIAGHCLGGGLEIALACDFVMAARGNYRLGLPEIKLGLIPGNGGTQRLVRRTGLAAAMELLTTGNSIDPERAQQLGLIDQLIAADALEQLCQNFAEQIAQAPGLALAASKKALRMGASLSLEKGLALEAELADSLYETADAKEGLQAFIEKRAPVFNKH